MKYFFMAVIAVYTLCISPQLAAQGCADLFKSQSLKSLLEANIGLNVEVAYRYPDLMTTFVDSGTVVGVTETYIKLSNAAGTETTKIPFKLIKPESMILLANLLGRRVQIGHQYNSDNTLNRSFRDNIYQKSTGRVLAVDHGNILFAFDTGLERPIQFNLTEPGSLELLD